VVINIITPLNSWQAYRWINDKRPLASSFGVSFSSKSLKKVVMNCLTSSQLYLCIFLQAGHTTSDYLLAVVFQYNPFQLTWNIAGKKRTMEDEKGKFSQPTTQGASDPTR
jgi:hypothetical protein